MLQILVADDHAIVREGLKQVLSEEFQQATISETSSAQGTLDLIKTQKWDILILDIHFPDRNGVEILKEVKSLQPDLPVVVLSFSPEDQYGIRVLKAGGAAYLNKESAPEELISSVKKVLEGGRYVSAALAEQLAASIAPPPHHAFIPNVVRPRTRSVGTSWVWQYRLGYCRDVILECQDGEYVPNTAT